MTAAPRTRPRPAGGRARAAAPRSALLLLLLAAALSGCARPAVWRGPARPGPYDQLQPLDLEGALLARAAIDEGRLADARRILEEIATRRPRNLPIAAMLQDVELALLAEGGLVGGLGLGEGKRSPEARLAERYRARAERAGDAASLVLAARLALDPAEAHSLLDRAVAADPRCTWAHYGRAWTLTRTGRLREAEEAMERAFALDPGHVPTRRLEAALLARAGERERAIAANEAWLADVAGDPLVSPARRDGARLDLAALLVQDGEPARALHVLDAFEGPGRSASAGAELVRAAAFGDMGFVQAALASAARAAEAAPDDPLPLVQRAIIQGERAGDPEGEREAWRAVLELLDGERAPSAAGDAFANELAGLVLRLQAEARLARLERKGGEGGERP